MNPKKWFTILILICLPFLLKAQSNFKPGFYVENSLDTIRGFIDYREWDKNPYEIRFKKNISDKAVLTLNPNYIHSFQILGLETFISFPTRISLDPMELNKIGQGLDSSFEKKSVFLKVLVLGPKYSLLKYTDNLKTRFYYVRSQSNEPIELEYHIFYKNNDPQSLEIQKKYRDQLENLNIGQGPDIEKLNKKIHSVEYFTSDLGKIFNSLNGFPANGHPSFNKALAMPEKSPDLTSQNPNSKKTESQSYRFEDNSAYRAYLGSAANISILKFIGGLPLTGQSTSVFPELRGGYDYLFNKNTQKLLFRYELSAGYHSYSLSKYNPSGPNALFSESYSFNVKGLHFSLSPRFIYNIYNSPNNKIYGSLGAMLKYSLWGTYGLETNTANTATSIQENYPPLNNWSFLIPIQVGAILDKRWEINFQYLSSTLSQTLGWKVQEQSFSFGFNYLFK